MTFDDALEIAVSVKRVGTSSYTLDFVATKDGAIAARSQHRGSLRERREGRARPFPTKVAGVVRLTRAKNLENLPLHDTFPCRFARYVRRGRSEANKVGASRPIGVEENGVFIWLLERETLCIPL